MKNLILDLNNLYSRCKYVVKESDDDLYVSSVAHTLFSMIRESVRRFTPDRIIGFCDGKGSWRKLIYPQYKANRNKQRTPKEERQDELSSEFFIDDFIPLLKNDTCIPVVDGRLLEADDLIATYVYMHKDDENIICSTDGDFLQLVSDKTKIYNSMQKRIVTADGVIDTESNKKIRFLLKDGKITTAKEIIYAECKSEETPGNYWIQYALFCKCIRGDHSDNISSAYPKITEKSTKKRFGLYDAFYSQFSDGFAWNSFMNMEWEDLLSEKHKVQDLYNRNKLLIDLSLLPCDLRNTAIDLIKAECSKPKPDMVLKKLNRFFAKYNLIRLQDEINDVCYPYITKYVE